MKGWLLAVVVGLGRVLGSPRLVIGLWLVNLLVALPAASIVTLGLRESIGASRVHEGLRDGFDMAWYGEYRATARGIAATFTPEVTGVGAFFDNLEAWLTGTMFTRFPELVGFGALYLLVWAAVLGGVLDRYAYPREDHSLPRFFESAGRFFFRFARLAMVSGALYVLIYLLYRWSYGEIAVLTRDVTSERVILALSLAVTALAALLLVLVHVSFAYAKIVTVIEGRRSMLLAALHGLGFVLTHPARALGLYFSLAAVSGGLLALYAWLAPGAGQATAQAVLLAFLGSQAFLLARLLVRLWLLGAQTALYQSLTGLRVR